MFDFAWSEIALIGVVALIAIGPKDMPVAIKAVTSAIKKARRMAAEFQTHVDEMMREANLDEVRNQFNEIRNFDLKGTIERAVDSDGSLRSTFARNPLAPDPPKAAPVASETAVIGEYAASTLERPAGTDSFEPLSASESVDLPDEAVAADAEIAPAFIPPAFALPPEPPPAFVPPNVAKQPARSARF